MPNLLMKVFELRQTCSAIDAQAQSFNATLECELLFKHEFHTQRAAEAAVFDFIYLSPVNYERRAQAVA